jgi:hypothetical protein
LFLATKASGLPILKGGRHSATAQCPIIAAEIISRARIILLHTTIADSNW